MVPAPEPPWQEGAGGLLLLAAAHQTGLLPALEAAIPSGAAVPTPAAGAPAGDSSPARSPSSPPRLAQATPASLRMLLLTLLFLAVVGLRRPWDLRGYSGDGLALLTGRRRAYGARHPERFLAELAATDGAERLTAALAAWTAAVWRPPTQPAEAPAPIYYLDGHRKAVYSEVLLPRGLIGRTGKVLGCRALLLLHDQHGHPLVATTHRGDLHLTAGVPTLLHTHAQAAAPTHLTRLVVDREGLAAEFLATLVARGVTVITVLRADQYTGLASFTDIGAFVPLQHDRDGRVVREVAPARYLLSRPEHLDAPLPLCVALVRDHRRQMPAPSPADDLADDEDTAPTWHGLPLSWTDPDWAATPLPAPATQPKLIPIVTTALAADPVALARTYTRRWPAQENIIKDWLLPLGLDTNHGFAKAPVVNSEVAKKREHLEQRLARLRRWAPAALSRARRASMRSDRLWEATKAHGTALYRELNAYQDDLADQGVEYYTRRAQVRERKAVIDEALQQEWAAYHRASRTSDQEYAKAERYSQEQRQVLRALEDLAAGERQMYELDDRKDQVMTVCTVAVANLGMWVRDQYFPPDYAHATWHRLAPFFRLPGRVSAAPEEVRVDLRPFNDRGLNRDLAEVCARVAAAQPQLPDGRRLVFTVSGASAHPLATLPAQHQHVA